MTDEKKKSAEDVADFSLEETPDGLDEFSFKDDKEMEKEVFHGDKYQFGRSDEDPLSPKQTAYFFVLAKEMGLSKDELKDAYDIDSISKLKFGEAKALLDKITADAGVAKEKKKEEVIEKEKELIWYKEAGVNKVGNGFAKCGMCTKFSGRSVEEEGSCSEGNVRGKYSGKKVAPVMKDCFIFKHGKLQKKKEINEDEIPF